MVGGPGGIEAFNSRLQPKPISRGSSQAPWPASPMFGLSGTDSLVDLRRRIDAYDKASSNDSFADTYVERTGIWGARIAAGEVSEHLYPKAKPELNNALHERLNPIASGAVSYEKILGLDVLKVKVGEAEHFKTYRSVASKAGWDAYKYSVTENFRGFLRPSVMEPVAPGEFVRNTLLGRNAEKITEQLKEGRFMAALSRIAGPLLLSIGIVSRTKDAYVAAKSEGITGLKLLGRTAKACLGQTVKSVMCWEAASVGVAIGAAAVCVGTVPALAGGILVGSIFGTACYKLLSQWLPDPPSGSLNRNRASADNSRR